MRRYDLAHCTLTPLSEQQLLETGSDIRIPQHRLWVPDLAERRPSVLAGDSLIAWREEEV